MVSDQRGVPWSDETDLFVSLWRSVCACILPVAIWPVAEKSRGGIYDAQWTLRDM